MPRNRRLLFLTLLFISRIAFCSDSTWCDNLSAALKASGEDHRSILVLVRNVTDIGSIDAGHWLEDKSLTKPRQFFHCVKLWHPSPELKEFPFAPRSGLLFLDWQSRPIAVEDIPFRLSEMKTLLEKIAEFPQPNLELSKPPDTQDKGRGERRQLERMFKSLSDELKEQMKELFGAVKAAAGDKKAETRAREIVKAQIDRAMTEDECQRTAGVLMYAIMELEFADEKVQLA
jgi:hypothetical protein